MPNIWVCKTGDGIGADYKKLIKSGIGGFVFTGGTFNPLDYRSLEDLDEAVEKVWSDYSPGHLTGKSFGRQLWAIARDTRVGDWIYLECPSAAPKPKDPTLPKGSRGPQRTFVVAAGVVTGPYAFKPKHSCPHQLKVEWQWTGMELITYGFQHMVYVNIDSRQPQVMAALNAIWTPGKGSSLPTGAANKQKSVQDEPSIDEGWEEGQEVLKTHRKIERSAAATKAAKDAARTRGKGIIYCDSCGKAPFENYGVEIIEAHHVIPLSDTKGMSRVTTPSDFAMLCPTCHRAVHYVLSKGRTEGRDAIEEVRRQVLRRG